MTSICSTRMTRSLAKHQSASRAFPPPSPPVPQPNLRSWLLVNHRHALALPLLYLAFHVAHPALKGVDRSAIVFRAHRYINGPLHKATPSHAMIPNFPWSYCAWCLVHSIRLPAIVCLSSGARPRVLNRLNPSKCAHSETPSHASRPDGCTSLP